MQRIFIREIGFQEGFINLSIGKNLESIASHHADFIEYNINIIITLRGGVLPVNGRIKTGIEISYNRMVNQALN